MKRSRKSNQSETAFTPVWYIGVFLLFWPLVAFHGTLAGIVEVIWVVVAVSGVIGIRAIIRSHKGR